MRSEQTSIHIRIRMQTETQLQTRMNSPIGPLFLTASANGLTGLYWTQREVRLEQTSDADTPQFRILAAAKVQLEEYFSGARKQFDLPLDLRGTEFQRRVWESLRNIPYGETVSYSAIAQQIGHPSAVRAVGTANGKNPICIIVPCHRVLPLGGGVGGYSGGGEAKANLLSLESAR